MNNDKLHGAKDRLKGEAKEKWGKLTDDHSRVAEGKMDKAKGRIKQD